MRRYGIVAVLVAILLSGCTAKITAPVAVRVVPSSGAELERIFSDPHFASAQWGVKVVSLDRGEILYEHDATRLLMPASNNKLVTTAAALTRLGPEYRYGTEFKALGPIENSSLRGDLLIVGSGDPSLAPRFHNGDPFRVFRDWASKFKEKGILKIEGAIIGDATLFPAPPFGRGWEWDDLVYGYAAPVTALQFNENLCTVEVVPGPAEGAPAVVQCKPLPGYVLLDGQVSTGPAGSRTGIDIRRGSRPESLVVRGTIAAKADADTTTIAVENPTLYFLSALKKTFQEEGIDVGNAAIRELSEPQSMDAKSFLSHSSATLAEILKPLLKVSQNLYAETLARTLGLALRGRGTFEAGREVVTAALQSMAIPEGSYAYVDGSGLSRQNLVSADMLVRIFKYMYRSRNFAVFYDSLPIAGVDGTIRGRMRGTKAENNVHGKTGTIAYVRCLSGYVKTADGEMLAFAMIANNFLAPNAAVEYVQDSALEYLANFHRK